MIVVKRPSDPGGYPVIEVMSARQEARRGQPTFLRRLRGRGDRRGSEVDADDGVALGGQRQRQSAYPLPAAVYWPDL